MQMVVSPYTSATYCSTQHGANYQVVLNQETCFFDLEEFGNTCVPGHYQTCGVGELWSQEDPESEEEGNFDNLAIVNNGTINVEVHISF